MSEAEVVTVLESKNASSKASSLTDDHYEGVLEKTTAVAPGHGESAIPEDKKEEAIENLEDDWENDPENARNWPSHKKWAAISVVSLYTLISPLASSMMAPGLPQVAEMYNIRSFTVVALTLSIFLVSFAMGPLVLAPLSEMYGRTWILHIANIFSIGFSLGCAFSPNVGSLIAFRFMTGFSGSAPVAIGGGSVSDLFSARDRASAMALFGVGPLLGPALGPVAGGFITQRLGIKWVFIVIALVGAFASIVGIPVLKETYGPVIRLRKAKRSADPEAVAKAHPTLLAVHGSLGQVLWVNLTRPIVLLCRSFICFILGLYMAFMYGIYYLMFSTFPALFSNTYGFKAGVAGLAYLGMGVGFLVAAVFGAKTADQIYKYLADKNGGKGKPEMRMPALFVGSIFVPIGLLWYGWSAQAKIHWIMPIIGTGIFGFAMMTTFLPIQLYLVDSFTYAASAVAAGAVFRSMLGFAFPLFGKQMFDRLGEGPGNTLLAGVAVILGIPFPIWIYYKGEAMRARSQYTR